MADKKCPGRRLPHNQGSRLVSLYAVTSVAYGGPAGQTGQRIGSPVKHCNGDHGKELRPVSPQVDPSQVVGAQQPDKATQRCAPPEAGNGVRCEPCPKVGLESGDRDPCTSGKLSSPPQPLGEGQHAAHRFEWIVRRYEPPHFMEAQLTACGMTDEQMPLMSRIE